MDAKAFTTHNLILRALRGEDRQLISPHLELVSLDIRTLLQTPGEPIEKIYFPEDSIASVIAAGERKDRVEIGLIGNEGMTGFPIILADDRSPLEIIVQVAGRAWMLPAAQLRVAMARSETLRSLVLGYTHNFMLQISYTGLANGRQKLESRLARWLLMLFDRVSGEELPLTHEFIAVMLGVRRPGVTVAIHILEGMGYIRATRSRIQLVDRAGLEQSASGFYGVPEREYGRLMSRHSEAPARETARVG